MRGHVKIRSYAENPEAIFSYALTDQSGKRKFLLTRLGGNAKAFIAAIEGIADRSAAELLKGTELYADTSQLPVKKDNEWYYGELTGLEVRLEDGTIYGHVAQIYNFGAGDILEIKHPDGNLEMLPFREPFVGKIHTDKGYLEVRPPEYVEEDK